MSDIDWQSRYEDARDDLAAMQARAEKAEGRVAALEECVTKFTTWLRNAGRATCSLCGALFDGIGAAQGHDVVCPKNPLRPVIAALEARLAEVERLRGRLEKASRFNVRPPTARMAGFDAITVDQTPQVDDSILWAVRRAGGQCLNRDGDWEYEPMPSNRDDEFLARCRFPSLDAAWSAAEKAAQAHGGEGRA